MHGSNIWYCNLNYLSVVFRSINWSWFTRSTQKDLSGLQPTPQQWALCNWALHTWCQPQFMSLTTIPLVKPYQVPGGSKQTQSWADINSLWHSAPIGCTSLLHTITFIISFHGSSCSTLLSSSVSLGLIDTAVYAWDLCNCRPSEVPLALEHRHTHPFQDHQENTCNQIICDVKFYDTNQEKFPIYRIVCSR